MGLHCQIMNISYAEVPLKVVAKTCRYNQKQNDKVTYSFMEGFHSLCLDKKDIVSAELEACQRLLKCTLDEVEKKTIEREIAELKMTFDLMP
jgi:hypothetical protein